MLKNKNFRTGLTLLIATFGMIIFAQSCSSSNVKDAPKVENENIKAELEIESIEGKEINLKVTLEALNEITLKNVTAEYYESRVTGDAAKLTDIELVANDYDMPLNEPESVDAKFTVSKLKDSQYIRVFIKYLVKETEEAEEAELFLTMKDKD